MYIPLHKQESSNTLVIVSNSELYSLALKRSLIKVQRNGKRHNPLILWQRASSLVRPAMREKLCVRF